MNARAALAARVRQHQAGVLLDTNVLLLHLARQVSEAYVGEWKRTAELLEPIYGDILDVVLASAKKLITTPHVLTEASNLASEPVKPKLRELVPEVEERSISARVVAQDVAFLRLGLADCALLTMAGGAWRKPLIVTVDGPLTLELERRSLPFVNLNHVRFA